MKLTQLLAGVAVSKLFQTMFGKMVVTHDVDVHGIQYDSRKVGQNDCFVAFHGGTTDGHRYIQDAISKGAKVVVMQDDQAISDSLFMHTGTVKVVVQDSRKALALMAANYYGHPSKKLRIIGITGTNGKTTTTNIVSKMLEAAGERVGLIGTIEYRIGSEVRPAPYTTPESLELQALLAEMVRNECTSVSMEVSSHALHQSRVSGVDFDVAVFTNLTQDHLDYHGSMEEYLLAKKRLFDQLRTTATAVYNTDDPSSKRMVSSTHAQQMSYGVEAKSDVQATSVALTLEGTSFSAVHNKRTIDIQSPLVGRFNVYNMLAACTAGLAVGIPPEVISTGMRQTQNVRGRFERFLSPRGWTAIVDFAHTPDALEKCLHTIQEIMPTHQRGKVITVFGAGGDRDQSKRPIMGAIAAAGSDLVIVTSDNPRTEDPEKIIDEIIRGISTKEKVRREPDRLRAITEALHQAEKGDVVLVAGKGHEEYQIIGTERTDFSDQKIIQHIIASQR